MPKLLIFFITLFFFLTSSAQMSESIHLIEGELIYSNPLFARGVSSPVIVLEDQTGFINRDSDFVPSPASQTYGQLTSDFSRSPVAYELALPMQPRGQFNDVDNDDQSDTGVQIFQIAYYADVYGVRGLGQRDFFGGGWSRSYGSAQVSLEPNQYGEIIGGYILVYASDDEQSFPTDFGPDGRLFTVDDPVQPIASGYTLIDMHEQPFSRIRSASVYVPLTEATVAAADDFSGLAYVEAFDTMLDKFQREYAFTEYKNVDWDALAATFRPRFAIATANDDSAAYERALQEFLWQIPDGHLSMTFTNTLLNDFFAETDGGLGIAIGALSDDRVIVTNVIPGTPASEAGIQHGAEILQINGIPALDYVDSVRAWSGPFSTSHERRLQNLRYATRFAENVAVTLTVRNPDEAESQTLTLMTVFEPDSFAASSFEADTTGYEFPVDYRVADDVLIVRIRDFLDDGALTMMLWERLLRDARLNDARGIVLDMRNNGGGRVFLAHQMAAYFFREDTVLGQSARYSETAGRFVMFPDREKMYVPAAAQRFDGPVAVLVGPNCGSACEFFAYAMTTDDRARVFGHYPTRGLGGGIEIFSMPAGVEVAMTTTRAVDADGNIHIEGRGVIPDVLVPVTETTLLNGEDAVLQAALEYLRAVN